MNSSSSGFLIGSFGAGALAVGIIGLAGLAPWVLAGIGIIVLGLLLLAGGTQSAHASAQALAEAGIIDGFGFNSQSTAGAAGIVLGILTLLGVAPAILTGAAIIAFGAAFIPAAGDEARRTQATFEHQESAPGLISQHFANAASGMLLIGAGDLVLGIIAISKFGDPSVAASLILVAILSTGAVSFLAGSGSEKLLGNLGL